MGVTDLKTVVKFLTLIQTLDKLRVGIAGFASSFGQLASSSSGPSMPFNFGRSSHSLNAPSLVWLVKMLRCVDCSRVRLTYDREQRFLASGIRLNHARICGTGKLPRSARQDPQSRDRAPRSKRLPKAGAWQREVLIEYWF